MDLCGNRFVDLSETGLWTYRKPVCGPIGNRFEDLSETDSCPAPKGAVRLSEVGAGVPKLVRGPMR